MNEAGTCALKYSMIFCIYTQRFEVKINSALQTSLLLVLP
jgi:hypothetical protein